MSPGNKILRVVIDTNVLFSATALPKDSPPTLILNLARAGKLTVLASPFILTELENNLTRKAGWDKERVQALKKKLRGFITIIEPSTHLDTIKRVPADNRILECALDAKADALITGNMKDLRPLGDFRGISILTPREFLDKHFERNA